MKYIKLIPLLILCCSQVCPALKSTSFSDTETYIERAKDIIIAECLSSPKHHGFGTVNDVDIKKVLKGEKVLGKFKIFTTHQMEVGQVYLLMNQGGETQGTDFLAISELSVVQIPGSINLDGIKEKNLKDKLHFIFASRLWAVERKLQPLLAEKALLDKALINRTDNLYVSPKPIHIDKLQDTYAVEYRNGEATYLKLNSKVMEWSRGSDQSGYIYSSDPNTHLPVWEFAYIDYANFESLEGKKLKVNFGSVYIPPGGDTMTVRVNQMILARHFEHPMTIYVMKFVKQEVDKVFVQYAVIDDIDKELTN